MKTTLQTLVIMAMMAAVLYGLIELGSHYPKQFGLMWLCICGVIVFAMIFTTIKSVLDEKEQKRKMKSSLNDRE